MKIGVTKKCNCKIMSMIQDTEWPWPTTGKGDLMRCFLMTRMSGWISQWCLCVAGQCRHFSKTTWMSSWRLMRSKMMAMAATACATEVPASGCVARMYSIVSPRRLRILQTSAINFSRRSSTVRRCSFCRPMRSMISVVASCMKTMRTVRGHGFISTVRNQIYGLI